MSKWKDYWSIRDEQGYNRKEKLLAWILISVGITTFAALIIIGLFLLVW